jgi:crotonobetainyl-CoA:carnitine CoA-transferase CaiB-like acyl-CoA transferase
VRSLEEALNPEELAELGMLAEYDSPVFGKVRSIGSPVALSGYQPDYSAAPALDADRVSLLEGLGMSTKDIEELQRRGAFGTNR